MFERNFIEALQRLSAYRIAATAVVVAIHRMFVSVHIPKRKSRMHIFCATLFGSLYQHRCAALSGAKILY